MTTSKEPLERDYTKQFSSVEKNLSPSIFLKMTRSSCCRHCGIWILKKCKARFGGGSPLCIQKWRVFGCPGLEIEHRHFCRALTQKSVFDSSGEFTEMSALGFFWESSLCVSTELRRRIFTFLFLSVYLLIYKLSSLWVPLPCWNKSPSPVLL